MSTAKAACAKCSKRCFGRPLGTNNEPMASFARQMETFREWFAKKKDDEKKAKEYDDGRLPSSIRLLNIISVCLFP